jgi:hypothetical protein
MPERSNPAKRGPTVRELIRTNPVARVRLGRAYAWLLGWVLMTLVTFTSLIMWLLIRRSKRLRERLSNPKPVEWPNVSEPRDAIE